MSQKRTHSQSLQEEEEQEEGLAKIIFKSAPIEDRSSIFTAAYSPNIAAPELQSLDEFQSATHRIAAWRKRSKQITLTPAVQKVPLCDTGSDDDGEKWAGKRLEKVLADMNVLGAVVVARWYGGVMLGPVRFSHIEDCARRAIAKWFETKEHNQKKRMRMEDEKREREALVRTLQKRDESIRVLRGLLLEKTTTSTATATPTPTINATTAEGASTAKTADKYSNTPLPALKQLNRKGGDSSSGDRESGKHSGGSNNYSGKSRNRP